jgi:hypothetical protein
MDPTMLTPVLTLVVVVVGFGIMIKGALPVWQGGAVDLETKRRAENASAAWVETVALVTILVKLTASGQPLDLVVGGAATLGFLVAMVFLPSLTRFGMGIVALGLVLLAQPPNQVMHLTMLAAGFLLLRWLVLRFIVKS